MAIRKASIILVTTALCTAYASASLTLVTSRAAIGATDSINWSSLGSTFTHVADGTIGSTVNGMNFSVTGLGQGFERRDESNGWLGNFTPGDALLWTTTDPQPMALTFAQSVMAVGANISADYFGAFTAHIEAFDGIGTDLGGFDLAGNNQPTEDGSAVFLGVMSTAGDIQKVVFTVPVTTGTNNDFSINSVSLNCGCAPFPSPRASPSSASAPLA